MCNCNFTSELALHVYLLSVFLLYFEFCFAELHYRSALPFFQICTVHYMLVFPGRHTIHILHTETNIVHGHKPVLHIYNNTPTYWVQVLYLSVVHCTEGVASNHIHWVYTAFVETKQMEY